VLQCVLQRVFLCVVVCVAVYVAVCCNALQRVAVRGASHVTSQHMFLDCSVLQCVAVCVAVSCSTLQCVVQVYIGLFSIYARLF